MLNLAVFWKHIEMPAETDKGSRRCANNKERRVQRMCVKDFSSFDWVWGKWRNPRSLRSLGLNDFEISAEMSLEQEGPTGEGSSCGEIHLQAAGGKSS